MDRYIKTNGYKNTISRKGQKRVYTASTKSAIHALLNAANLPNNKDFNKITLGEERLVNMQCKSVIQ
jgi:hypothetical protein